MLPRDIDTELENGESRGRRERRERDEPSLREEGQAIDTLTEPLMYVIDLLCDALALRVPDTLSSAPMLDVPNDGREGMERS